MVKVDIVRAIQLGTDLQFGEAEKLVNDMLELIKEKLEKGEDVLITGLGKFELRDKNPGQAEILNQKGIMLFQHEEL